LPSKKSLKPRRKLLLGTNSVAGRKIAEALSLLRSAGVPVEALTNFGKESLALALLATANMKPNTPWSEAEIYGDDSNWKLASREIIEFQNAYWKQKISSGSYDDIRRKHLEPLVLAGIVLPSAGKPNSDPNDPTRKYAINPEASALLRTFGTKAGELASKEFVDKMGSLEERMERRRPKKLNAQLPDGRLLELAAGPHNTLQKAVLEKFIPRFLIDAQVLYLGDAIKKSLHSETKKLADLGFKELAHGMLPDIVLLDVARNWIFLIEAVHSSNPISKLRHLALEEFTIGCSIPKVFVSVFASRSEFRKWVVDISWETEVWIVDSPDHMIHFNGDKFLGPYPSNDAR
jgi:BsuBI/PstI restriction endonuclease domain/BsuBI/PstI restriction endonuclease HTH domain